MSFPGWASAAALSCSFFAFPILAAELDPVGQWEVSTGESRYRITHCGKSGAELCAKLTWLREDARTEENLDLLNKTVVRGAPADDNKWTGTVLYEGQSYVATVTFISKDAIRVHSCSGIICQSFELNRL